MKPDKKSPIKDKPLRLPGQSLDRRRADLLDDRLMAPMLLAGFMVVTAGMEWWRYFNPRPFNPLVYTFFAVLTVLYAAWQVWRTAPVLKQLRQASEGEKAVGQFLERLRENGYQVFHDVIGEGFNLDHVLIGPAGVFTVETKTLSKPVRGEARIKFDGEKFLVDGFEPDRNPVIQAKAQANWLRGLLSESTGRQFVVSPVVVFPGWFIEQRPGTTREIWALEPKALAAFLGNAPAILSNEEVKLAGFHLSRFIREGERGNSR